MVKFKSIAGKKYVICSRCNTPIQPGTRVIVGEKGAIYHVACNRSVRGSVGYV